MGVPVMRVGVGEIMNFLEGWWDMPTLFPDALPGVSWLVLSPPNLLGQFCFLVQAVFISTRRAHGTSIVPEGIP